MDTLSYFFLGIAIVGFIGTIWGLFQIHKSHRQEAKGEV